MAPSACRSGIATALLLLALCTTSAMAVDFAGGTGEPNAPYQIATAEQLLAVDDDPNLVDKHFALVADIDLDPALPGREVFLRPILYWGRARASSSIPFKGQFDGHGYTIRNYVVYAANDNLHAGLLGTVGESGRICNLRLENVLIVEDNRYGLYCGALAGENAGFVVNCSATGTILADTTEYRLSPGGGLIGYNSGFVVNCRADCDVFGGRIGGLIGENNRTGRIVSCSSGGVTIGDEIAGGLVGTNAGLVQYSFVEGSVLGYGAAGLVSANSGTICESYGAGFGSWGSLISANSGIVLNCYATGTSPVDSYRSLPGGLVGTNRGTIMSSYSARVFQMAGAAPEPLPLVGTSNWGDAVRQSYDLGIEEPASTRRGGTYTTPFATALSAEQMQQQASFPGLDFVGDANDGIQDHWFMPAEGYPILTWQAEPTERPGIPDVANLTLEQAQELLRWTGFTPDGVSYDYARSEEVCEGYACHWVNEKDHVLYTRPGHYAPLGSSVEIVISLGSYDFSDNPGDGSESNPYQIETAGQLDGLYDREDLWASHFLLTADLDLTYQTYPRAFIEEFSGTFDGNGHTLRYRGQNGLFGTIEPNGVVHDLNLESAYISATARSEQVGMLAGRNEGRIERCTTGGRILSGATYVGGLVGYNAGQITDCRVRGQILPETTAVSIGGLAGQNDRSIVGSFVDEIVLRGKDNVGGLVGMNYGADARIEASYAHGNVQGADCVGGLVGANAGGPFRRRSSSLTTADDPTAVVRHCYATCAVTGEDDIGGCVGFAHASALQESCYFLALEDGGGPDNGYGTALSAEQMRRQASFVAWDFEDIWMICEEMDYPRLQWEGIDREP